MKKLKMIILAITCTPSLTMAYEVVRVEEELPGLDHFHILQCDSGMKREVLEHPKKSEFWYSGQKFKSLDEAARTACKE